MYPCIHAFKKKNIPHQFKEIHFEKRVVFQYDNVKSYTFLVTRQKLLELGLRSVVYIHLDLAPSDYHLFRSVQNSLNGNTFNDADKCKITFNSV